MLSANHNYLPCSDWQQEDWAQLALSELNLSFNQSHQLSQLELPMGVLFQQANVGDFAGLLSDQQLQRWRQWQSLDLAKLFAKQGRWLADNPAQLIAWQDELYPAQLKTLAEGPGWFWCQGNAAILADPGVGMVGGRYASPSGLSLAKEYGQSLAAAGLTVISGLALGIDGASHEGALAVGGDTIAVLGSGLACLYPPRHGDLAQRIIHQAGALVSPWPLFCEALPFQFPARNRIISGLGLGVLVVEAAHKSGSLITARAAAEQGREVYALPAGVHNRKAQGSLALLQGGATLVTNAADIVADLAPQLVGLIQTEAASGTHLPAQLQQLLNQFGDTPLPIDIICQQSLLPYAEVASQLMELTLLGYLAEGAQGYERIK
jgi:DNA processing protein